MISVLRRRSLAGFTLIELLIVIVIIGILIAIGVPAYLKYTAAANDRDAQAALTTAYKAALAGDTEVNTGRFPIASTVVSDVKTDEPQTNVARGDCYGTIANAPVKQVLVDPTSSSSQITMCVKSASGTIWRLSGPLTGTPTVADGSTAPLVFAGTEITDAVRTAGSAGDGRNPDSSTGVWNASANIDPAGADASLHGYNGSDTGAGSPVSGGFYRFPKNSPSLSQIYSQATTVSITNGTTYTWSCVIRTDGTGWDFRPGTWDASLGNIEPATTVVDLGNGTYRLSGTWTSTTTMSGLRAFDLWEANWGTSTYVDVKWAQLEASPNATPYMPGGTARAVSRVQAPAALLDPAQGWVAMRVRVGWLASQKTTSWPGFFAWSNVATTTFMLVYYNPPGNAFYFKYGVGGVVQDDKVIGSYTPTGNGYATVIAQWSSTQIGGSVNGASFTWWPVGTPIPAAPSSLFDIGNNTNASSKNSADSDFLWFAAGKGTLSNADAATINGFGNTDPARAMFPSAAQTDFIWDGTSAAGSMK